MPKMEEDDFIDNGNLPQIAATKSPPGPASSGFGGGFGGTTNGGFGSTANASSGASTFGAPASTGGFGGGSSFGASAAPSSFGTEIGRAHV